VRGAIIDHDESVRLDSDMNRFDARTDSYEDDPFVIVKNPSIVSIGEITATIARLLFPDLPKDAERDYRLEHAEMGCGEYVDPQGLRLWDYGRRSASDVEAAWRKVLQEHDEEQVDK